MSPVEAEARCQRPEGPGRRSVHRRVGLLRRAQEDRLVVRQPDRPGDARARSRHPPRRSSRRCSRRSPTSPSSRGRAWPGRSWCPCSATVRSSGSTRSTSSGWTAREWPSRPRPVPRVRSCARRSASWSPCLRPSRTCWPRNPRWAARSASAGAARWSSPRVPKSWPRSGEHPQLKGYLEPGAPPGYLLLKSRSNPDNFVQRCQDLGFEVTSL